MTAAVQPDAQRFHVTRVDGDTGLVVQDCRMTILASADDTGGHLGVVHIVAPPGHEPPLHVHHDEDEAYFVLAGRLSVRCGDRQADVGAGSWVYLPRGFAHNLRVIGPEPAHWLLLAVPGGFEAFFRDQSTTATGPGLPVPQPPDVELLGRLFARHHIETVTNH